MTEFMSRAGREVIAMLVFLLGFAGQAVAGRSIPDEWGYGRKLPGRMIERLRTIDTEMMTLGQDVEDLRVQLAFFPEDPDTHGWRAWFYARLGEHDSAIGDMLFVVSRQPENLDARTFLAELYVEKATSVYEQNVYSPLVWEFNRLAVGELLAVLRSRRDDQDAIGLLAIALNNQAYHLYRHGEDLQTALQLIDWAITLAPKQTFYLSTKAEVLYALGHHKEALLHIQRALRDYPDEPELLQDLHRIQSALSKQP